MQRAPGFEHVEDQALPLEIRRLCGKVPRKRMGIELLGSAADEQYIMHVGLDQPAEPPPQTVDRLARALATLQGILSALRVISTIM